MYIPKKYYRTLQSSSKIKRRMSISFRCSTISKEAKNAQVVLGSFECICCSRCYVIKIKKWKTQFEFQLITRLHSSRMNNVCLLHVSPSMHYSLGGVCSRGSAPRGSTPRGCLSLVLGGWGVSAPGEGRVCSRGGGGCLPLVPGGVGVSQHAMRQTPPVNRILDTLLEILPCPKLRLRAVIRFLLRRRF